MHDGMPYGPIQGQGQGHVALKVRNSSIFEIYLLRQMTADSLTTAQSSKNFLVPSPSGSQEESTVCPERG